MEVETISNVHLDIEDVSVSAEAVVEEIDEDESITLTLGRTRMSPLKEDKPEEPDSPSTSPVKVKREFGNISPISELLDEDDIEILEQEEGNDDEEDAEAAGKVTPEPGIYPLRNSLPKRISDGRSSPILAFSPSLVKSPSSTKPTVRMSTSSPSSSGGKRPRNISRMLDNISDHSSSEDDVNVNAVGVMMAKFKV
ncbi:unnamed protein product [Orchesella dallaii]|uniref:Uncharacterized protein n=1 Tax=Orchesella dallaii TaxID=48710 RepID=A0ABP1RWY6_9HEXA